jgi:coenzyme F420-reducing hydrogenase delta subunit
MIMSALRSGADGILVAGGSFDDCHSAGEKVGDHRRFVLLENLLEFIGVEPGRVHLSWESASPGDQLRVLIENFTEEVKALGPASKLVKQLEPVQVVE